MFRVFFTVVASATLIAVAAFSRPPDQAAPPASPSWVDAHRVNADRLIREAQTDRFAWDRLAELTDTFGNRLSGSENLVRAITWAAEQMRRDGLDSVHTERVMVPRWVRGAESLTIVEPPEHTIPMLGLGGSVATPADGLEADVLVVRSFDELTQRAAEAKGKIVLFNAAYVSYGQTNAYRTGGASAAGRVGAVAALV
nr:peptidase M28 family protein [Acidobacteriota bacterium]